MKVALTSPTQGWFLLSVLGPAAVDYLKKLSPADLRSTGKLIDWLGKDAEERAAGVEHPPKPTE